MSESYDDLGAYDAVGGYEVADDPADELEDAFIEDPIAVVRAVVDQAAGDVEARVRAQVQTEADVARAERMTTVVREAGEAMAEKYGEDWGEKVPTVADVLRVDAARGTLPLDDALELARHTERVYLAERERSKPSQDEINRAHWERVMRNADRRYGD